MILVGIALFFVSLVLLLPMRHKPLYCDDGNWFYYAVFRGISLDWYVRKMAGGGFFKLHWIFRVLYRLFPGEGVSKLYVIKAFWYSLTIVANSVLAWQLTQSLFVASVAGIVLLFLFLLPDSRAAVTYGEVFLLLPVLISAITAILSFQTNNFYWLIASGLFAAWAMQIKIIALVPALIVSIASALFHESITALGLFWGGFVFLYVLPALFIPNRKQGLKLIYIKETLGFFVRLIAGYCGGTRCPKWLGKLVGWTVTEDHRMGADYVSGIMQITFGQQIDQMKRMVLPILRNIPVVLLFALSEVVSGILTGRWMVVWIFGAAVVLWLLIVVQKTHLPSRYLMVWAPVAILAAMCMEQVTRMMQLLPWRNPVFIAIGIAVIWQVGKMVTVIARSMRGPELQRLANYNDRFNGYFAAARPVGEYIREYSNPRDTMLVWGNIPSVYLYAGVPIPDIRFTHIYPAGTIMKPQMMEILINTMYLDPPAWIIFMQGITAKDDWSMQKLQPFLPVSYKVAHSVEIKVGKNVEVVHIYRRRDDVWRDVCIDRWQRSGDVEYLEPVANEPEVALIQEYVKSENQDRFLSEYDAQTTQDKVVISRLQGDIFKRKGQLDLSERCYQQALMVKADDFRSHLGLGEIAFHRGDLQGAFNAFQKVYQMHPYSVEALNNMAVILYQAGKPEEARQCLIEALRIAPDYEEAVRNLEQMS